MSYGYNFETQSCHISIGMVKFRRVSVGDRVYLVINGNYYYGVNGSFEGLVPDSEWFAKLVTLPRELVLGLESYCTLRKNESVPFSMRNEEESVRRARPVWIPDTFEGDLQPPLKTYTVVIRDVPQEREPRNFWRDVSCMCNVAAAQCDNKGEELTGESWLKQLYPERGDFGGEYHAPEVLDEEEDFFMTIPHVAEATEIERSRVIRGCAQALTIMTQVPHNLRKVYVDEGSEDQLETLHYKAAVRKSEKTRTLVVEDEADLCVFYTFADCELARTRVVSSGREFAAIVILDEGQYPSPQRYSAVGAYRGKIHTTGFKIRNFKTWEYHESTLPELYTDHLVPGRVYAAHSVRAFTHMRVLWNMGYDNPVCTNLDHVERGVIPHTYDAFQLVTDTVYIGYAGYVDLFTGKCFKLNTFDMGGKYPSVWTLKAGTLVTVNGYVSGRAREVAVVKGDKTWTAWLFMKSQMVKVFDQSGDGSSARSVIVRIGS